MIWFIMAIKKLECDILTICNLAYDEALASVKKIYLLWFFVYLKMNDDFVTGT